MIQRLVKASKDGYASIDDLNRHLASDQKVVRDSFFQNFVSSAKRLQTIVHNEVAPLLCMSEVVAVCNVVRSLKCAVFTVIWLCKNDWSGWLFKAAQNAIREPILVALTVDHLLDRWIQTPGLKIVYGSVLGAVVWKCLILIEIVAMNP